MTTLTIYILGGLVLIFLIISIIKKLFVTSHIQNSLIKDFSLLEVQVLRSTNGPVATVQDAALAAENLFSSLHGLLREEAHLQEYFSFEMVSSKTTGVRFYVAVPNTILKFVEGQIYAQYPDAQITLVSDYAQELVLDDSTYEIATLGVSKPYYYPLKSFRDIEMDPLSSIASVLSQVGDNEKIYIQYLVKPKGDTWQDAGYKYAEDFRSGKKSEGGGFFKNFISTITKELFGLVTNVVTGFFKYNEATDATSAVKKPEVRLTPIEDLQIRSIENKLTKMGYDVEIRIVSAAENKQSAEEKLRLILASYQQLSSSNLNAITSKVTINKQAYLEKYKQRAFEPENTILLNVEELATIFHFPSSSLETPNISWVYSRKTEPPANLPTKDCVYLGETVFRNSKVKFGIKNEDDRLRHMYIIGKSGTGKSTIFENMISQDIANGFGVGILDPHGETVEKVLERIPDNRIDDVVVFDPSDTERPVGLNLLQIDDPSQKNLLASGLVSALKHQFDYSWGPRLEYLLNYAVLTLLDVPGTTMLGITRLLEDQNYQKFILHQVKDPVVVRFWEKEFKEMKGNQKLVTEAIAPIQNKVNRFLASSTMRNILGQKTSTIDIWDVMNSGKILLINLSKGKVGADNANLLGALLVSRIQFYALQRAKIPYENRRPFYLYVDEFQNFATGSFEEILSESRKYKLGLYLTHQFTAQLPEELLKAVYGNVGTIATFSLGAPDAKALANEFAPYYTDEDIISLQRFEIYIKLMIDGMTSIPFSGRILLPWLKEEALVPKYDNKARVLELSREKYGRDRAFVEEKTARWIETPFDKGMAIALEYKKKEKEEQIIS